MTSEFAFPPGLIMVLGAMLIPLLGERQRLFALLGLPALTLAAVWGLPADASVQLAFLDYTLEPVRSTTVGRLFATVFAIMAFAGGLYAHRQATTTELTAAFVYAGSAIGVTFAGDLLTLFVFWEIMALGSTIVVWSGGTQTAYSAGIRYLLIHLLGGVVLMVGIVAYAVDTGSLNFTAMQPESLGTWLILIGFLVNAGAPPLSAWIADAYPEASPSGTVWRKCPYLVGAPESGQVTSIVRYEPDASFPAHDHPGGEEILVLEGCFHDEHGAYPAGSWIRNPDQSRHTPYTRDEGALIYVKVGHLAPETLVSI